LGFCFDEECKFCECFLVSGEEVLVASLSTDLLVDKERGLEEIVFLIHPSISNIKTIDLWKCVEV
jgi:hypothetical protein